MIGKKKKELDLSNFATKYKLDLSKFASKSDSKGATRIDISKFTKKADLANLKSDIDDLDVDKLKKLIMTQELYKLNRKYQTMINILLLMIVINFWVQYLLED